MRGNALQVVLAKGQLPEMLVVVLRPKGQYRVPRKARWTSTLGYRVFAEERAMTQTDLSKRTPEEVFNHHGQSLGAEDLDAILMDYLPGLRQHPLLPTALLGAHLGTSTEQPPPDRLSPDRRFRLGSPAT